MTLRRNPGAWSMALVALALGALAGAGVSTSVLDAVASKDKAALRSLLKSGADVNAAMGDGLTAIHQVAIDGDTELAQLLIYAGANLKATTRLGGYTPLLLAAKNGDAAMIETLLKGGADPNQATTNGTSPLMFAAASGNVAAVKVLLDKGADIAAKEKAMGQTPLMFAAANGRVDVVNLLVSRGADVKAATKVVDLWAFTKEAEEAFAAAVATAAPAAKKPAEGEAKAEDAAAPEAAAKPDAATEAAKAAGLGGATTLSAPANAPAAKTAEKADSKASKDKADKEKAEREKKEAAKAAKAEKKTPEMKDGPPKVALAQPPAAKPAPDAKTAPAPAAAEPAKTAEAPKPKKPLVGGVDRPYLYNELVAATGGMTPLHLAIRQGQTATVKALVEAGADVNLVSAGDKTSPLLMAIVNGQFDIALYLLDKGANPNLASENGAAPLYAVVNVQWAPKAGYPQPRAYLQQKASYLDVMKALLDKGAVVDARLKKKIWYQGYNFDLSGVDETGATAFWRAAYASDIDAMKLLVAHGADPNLRTTKIAGRPPTGDARREVKDVSGLPPVPVGGPAITALQAAAGVGYGEGFAANSHRFAPSGMLAAVKYLVEELHADVNAADHEGNTALHHAAARGDNEMIKYLVSKGANVMAVSREGKTTVDMANSPVSRIEPFPATIALLESMGAKNNHKCVSCDTGAVKTGAK
ncbi:MAG: ankyrin repeat domain-containing protein [Vicinamibacteria bacterium]|nr:ankyrin repeat domain-containing protein [Vicinamibacteria bacterium]